MGATKTVNFMEHKGIETPKGLLCVLYHVHV